MDYLWIILGFIVLTFGANALVNGASSVAKKMNVSDLLIGLTIVALGTSSPEMVVNIVAAVKGTSQIALTNIIGSNIINTCVILGVSALVCPLTTQRSCVRFDIPMSILASILLLVLSNGFFMDTPFSGLSRLDGLILLCFFVVFMVHSIRMGMKTKTSNRNTGTTLKTKWAITLILCGLAGLILGGELIVRSATRIASSWGVSDAVIGVTIVALGTSLPELATSVVAAIRGNVDLAIGNVIGSNILNVFFVLAISALIRPLDLYPSMWIDASLAIVCSVLVFLFVQGKTHRIGRWQGGFLVLIYVAYLAWIITTL